MLYGRSESPDRLLLDVDALEDCARIRRCPAASRDDLRTEVREVEQDVVVVLADAATFADLIVIARLTMSRGARSFTLGA